MTRRTATHVARDALVVAGVGLLVRLVVVAWAAESIPPAADGTFYDKLAVRIAEGHGYTWLWPDGVVTHAAHYPVGYPAMVALGYAVFGAKPVVAMILNALLGTAAGVATWSLVARASSARLALAAGLAVAIHPVLVPYTAALMTEGVTTSLVVVAAALAAHARVAPASRRWLVATGLVVGVATLVRPQSLALAPVLGWLAATGSEALAGTTASVVRRGVSAAAVVTATALAVCAPWTVRNCARMDRCALVSVNGGWNLAIGTQTESGGWHELTVPEACKTVFQEAAKDECFGREALRVIARNPGAWLARVPAKLRTTFDYFGAAPWYLHSANAERFPYRAKVALGAIETITSRLLLAAALVTLLRMRVASSTIASRMRMVFAAVGLCACVVVPGTIAYLALAAGIVSLGWRELSRAPLVVPFTAIVILATAATHAVFFGAGRYGIVVVPFVTALAFVRRPSAEPAGAASGHFARQL
ncbi:MAG TPA: glycosyltransferase family 39 protein [Labilithrix sp.]|nr:glycosyltransferase family 39 protein [Labilithrix sp.]